MSDPRIIGSAIRLADHSGISLEVLRDIATQQHRANDIAEDRLELARRGDKHAETANLIAYLQTLETANAAHQVDEPHRLECNELRHEISNRINH